MLIVILLTVAGDILGIGIGVLIYEAIRFGGDGRG